MRKGAATGALDRCDDGIGRSLAAVIVDADGGAGRGEFGGNGGAESAAGTGDEGDAVGEEHEGRRWGVGAACG